jgi:hypothetical protein
VSACSDFRSRLAKLLAGGEAAAPRANDATFGGLAWHEHLLGCADCRALIEAEQALEELLSQLPQPQLPPELARRLLARLEPHRNDPVVPERLLDSLLDRTREVSVPFELAERMLERLNAARELQLDETRLDRVLNRLPKPQPPEDLAERTLTRLALARRQHVAAQPELATRARSIHPSQRRSSRLALAAAALVAIGFGAWLLGRAAFAPQVDDVDPSVAQGRESTGPAVAPRERVIDEPPADLLASLDLLESWDLVLDDSVETDVLSLGAYDALLLEVADQIESEPAGETPRESNGVERPKAGTADTEVRNG